MAYAQAGWSTVSASKAGNSVALYAYSTADTVATVNTSGYFNDLSDVLSIGDIILVRSSTGGTQVVTINYVLTNSSGVVDVNDGLVVPATNTD